MKNIDNIKLDPTQVLVLGFAAVILVGALLLNLPIASIDGKSIGFLNALFTSTSAVCVTGLVVVDTGTYWTAFGKTVILILIQVGGLGFMTMATLFAIILGRKISLKERLVIQQALNQNSLSGLVRFTQYILIGTFIIEGIGALILSFTFVPELGWSKGIAYSIFHSISAFCNAGFDIIGGGVSLMPYVTDPVVNFTVWALIILGGIGFSVIVEVANLRKFKKLSLHSKIVIFMTCLLLGIGFVSYLLLEWNNPNTIGDLSFGGKLMASTFQSITPRTAGFNTVDTSQLTTASKMLTIVLMYIGGSPASTAGGIKTVTMGVILFTVITEIKGREDTEIFGRRLTRNIVNRSLTIGVIGMAYIIISTMLLTITDSGFEFIEVFFEAASALGTVGLSLGITSELSALGRIVIIFSMFLGRLGPLTIAFALARQNRNSKGAIRYPEEKIIVG
ncbi:TrkH family potassium uptake protein [Alkaliphilus peptidifermentans]|uniref:Trk system potassium uptake protein TrkH n=1 Tax=Alkaliphilus peptidifermentans DSM 18978 TaxID=1120976 RepID=A0A1G5IW69_9FIRM|nr:TrkH family potassium uptake protein [Alkaliphilus peptidifermentans]SCY80306.1 trk system potassium uptake protein TrkH [Alkaliphilus peptidifermentans DSM 18978]